MITPVSIDVCRGFHLGTVSVRKIDVDVKILTPIIACDPIEDV